jgi:hypothetical protein
MQRVHDVTSIVAQEAAAPVVVVGVTAVAEVRDRLVGARGIFSRDHVRLVEGHGDHAAGTDSVSPVEAKVRPVRDRIEATPGRDRHMSPLNAGRHAYVTELDMIARTTIAIHSAAEFLVACASLHRAPAYFTVSNFANA